MKNTKQKEITWQEVEEWMGESDLNDYQTLIANIANGWYSIKELKENIKALKRN